MVGLRFRAVFAVAALLMFERIGAHSQSALPPSNMVPHALDELGRAPNHFVWLREGPQSLQDPVDRQLVHIDDERCIAGRASLLRQFQTVACRNDDPENLGPFGRETPLESRIAETDDTELIRSGGPRFRLRIPTPPITRINALLNARVCLTVNGVTTQENYSRIGVENLCPPRQAKYWRRPILLTADLIAKNIGPMSYRWGGDDSPRSFRLRMDWGALAGDICARGKTPSDFCLMPDLAGVDCSGFVLALRALPAHSPSVPGRPVISIRVSRMTDRLALTALQRTGRNVGICHRHPSLLPRFAGK